MKFKIQTQTLASFTISALILIGFTACQSARVTPDSSNRLANAQTSNVRGPAGGPIPTGEEDTLIVKFVKSLVERSSLDEAGIEDVISRASDRDIGDIKKLSEADQKKVIDQLLESPGFAAKVAVRDLSAAEAARAEAIANATGIKPVGSTEPVPNIRGGFTSGSSASTSSAETFSFSKLLSQNPEMKSDIELLSKQNALIKSSTGVGVLGSGCDSVQSEEAFENLSTIMNGVQRDVASGAAKDAKAVAQSLEKNMSDVLGTDAAESHRRVCTLSEKGGCGIFNLQICIP